MNQQDAQEFLTYILDSMQEEFLQFQKKPEVKPPEKSEDGWEEVGKKNKSSVVLTVNVSIVFLFSLFFNRRSHICKVRSATFLEASREAASGSKLKVDLSPLLLFKLSFPYLLISIIPT